MKKLFLFLMICILSVAVAACGNGGDDKEPTNEGKTIYLNYSGAASDKAFNESLFEEFKKARAAAGDKNTYVIEYLEIGADKVDSTVLDWTAPNAPDVYEAASDKIGILYQKGVLAKVGGKYAEFIENYMAGFGATLVTMNGSYYAYPYTGDNTYYLQYDKSIFSEEDVKSIETLLDKAHELGYKVAYDLETAFWGAAALFTFGADYSTSYDEDGNVLEIKANFNGEAGLKAAKAIYKIMNHPAREKGSGVPTAESDVRATIGGTWDIAKFKEFYGDNYGCAVMPTVTVDGETKNLGCFVGGKFFGVNPQVSKGDPDRLVAAHELAMFLSDKDAQVKRYENFGIGPCHSEAKKHPNMVNDPNMIVLAAQAQFGHPQDAVPAAFWTAPTTFVGGIADGTITLENIQEAIDTLNNSIIGAPAE